MIDPPDDKIAYFGYTGLIDHVSVGRICASLNDAVNNEYDSVVLCLSSPGGFIPDGIYLYNHIMALPIPVSIYNTGSVASVAVVAYLAGSMRYCSIHATFMIHPTLVPSQGNLTSEILQVAHRSAQADELRIDNILRARAKLPDDLLEARRFKEVHLSPDIAVELGMVHEVREFALPRGRRIAQI